MLAFSSAIYLPEIVCAQEEKGMCVHFPFCTPVVAYDTPLLYLFLLTIQLNYFLFETESSQIIPPRSLQHLRHQAEFMVIEYSNDIYSN